MRLGSGLRRARRSFAIHRRGRNSSRMPSASPRSRDLFSYRDVPWDQGEIHLRTRSRQWKQQLTSEARAVLRGLDPRSSFDVRTLSKHIERNLYLAASRAHVRRLGPLLSACVGRNLCPWFRTPWPGNERDFGVRLTFGATSGRVVLQNYSRELGFCDHSGCTRSDASSFVLFPSRLSRTALPPAYRFSSGCPALLLWLFLCG